MDKAKKFLDKEMYDENKLWMPKLIELLKPLYSNRRKKNDTFFTSFCVFSMSVCYNRFANNI